MANIGNIIIDLGPQGETGPQGEKGDVGDVGPIGPIGLTGPQGETGSTGQNVSFYQPIALTLIPSSTATVTDVITYSNNTQFHQLTLGIPSGLNGTNGTNGTNGINGINGLNGQSIIYKGNFISNTQYYVNDVVYIYGSSYICIQNTNGVYIPKNDTGVNTGVVYQETIDETYLYWYYIAHKGDLGLQGPKGDTGDSNAGLGILIGALSGAAAAILVQILDDIIDALMDAFGLSNRPDPTEEDRVRALARLISELRQDVNTLQNQMSTVENEISALQSDMGYQQQKTEYQNTYTDILLNDITNFNSAITTTNGIFGESSRISQSGAATFSSLKCSTINTPYGSIRINGNIIVNGTVTSRSASSGNFQISGGQWEF